MSYYAPNTPSPASSTQIGYSYIENLTTSTTTTDNSGVTTTTAISNVPIGVWIVSGRVLGSGSGNAEVLTEATCQIFKGSVESSNLLITAGFSSNDSNNDSPISYIYLTPVGVFYSDGSTDLNVVLGVRSSSSTTTSSTQGNIVLTKIA